MCRRVIAPEDNPRLPDEEGSLSSWDVDPKLHRGVHLAVKFNQSVYIFGHPRGACDNKTKVKVPSHGGDFDELFQSFSRNPGRSTKDGTPVLCAVRVEEFRVEGDGHGDDLGP